MMWRRRRAGGGGSAPRLKLMTGACRGWMLAGELPAGLVVVVGWWLRWARMLAGSRSQLKRGATMDVQRLQKILCELQIWAIFQEGQYFASLGGKISVLLDILEEAPTSEDTTLLTRYLVGYCRSIIWLQERRGFRSSEGRIDDLLR